MCVLRGIAVMVFLIVLAGCGSAGTSLGTIGAVTRIEVRDNRKVLMKTISDLRLIHEITTFVDTQDGNWETPWSGIPAAPYQLYFYQGDTYKGSFGIGNTFITTQRRGGFFSQPASMEEQAALRRMLALPENNQ